MVFTIEEEEILRLMVGKQVSKSRVSVARQDEQVKSNPLIVAQREADVALTVRCSKVGVDR